MMVRLSLIAGAVIFAAGISTVASAQGEQTLKPQVVEQKPAAGAATASAGGFANSACTNGKNKRLLEIKAGSPCEVHYKKETEMPGHDQVLWNAKNDPTFCESKAQAFVQKLEGMGWTCSKI